MEGINGIMIYWFTSVGLIIGLIFGLVIRKEGISLWGNIIWGVISANIMGFIGIYMNIGDGLLFACVATLPFLFLVNVFHQHHIEDLFGEITTARIVKKK
jgi:hypothetical protein